MPSKTRMGIAAAVCLIATAAFAQRPDPAMMARQSQMVLNTFYLRALGDMARGKARYDAAEAIKAADSLVALSSTDWSHYWAKGTDNSVNPRSKMLPAVYDNLPDLAAKQKALHQAAIRLQSVAGEGQAGLRPAVRDLFQACNACHKSYRAPLR